MTEIHSNNCLDKILNKIRQTPEKKITFAEYMNLCLYDSEYGYYHQLENIGKQGDFYTSASLSSDLGELLATQFYEFWQVLGKPSPFHLVEMGAGDGVLARSILSYIKDKYPDFFINLQYMIIEKSSSLRKKQQQILQNYSLDKFRLIWEDLDSLSEASLTGCIFSNELVDAFPVHLVEWQKGEIKEVYLTENDGNLREVIDSISTEKIKTYFDHLNIYFDDSYPENYRTEVNLEAINWLKQISSKLKRGYLLTIDYGYTADKYYHPQRFQGTLKCYHQHRHHNNPYVNIGFQDITTHVNFTALQSYYGQLYQLFPIGYTSQALFLMGLGLCDRTQSLSVGKMSVMEVIQRRNQLHELINPEGLGGFKVLLQGKNLTETETKRIYTGFQENNFKP